MTKTKQNKNTDTKYQRSNKFKKNKKANVTG